MLKFLVKMTGFHSEVFPVHPLGLFQVANVEDCFICLYPYMKSAVNRKYFSLWKSAKGRYSILESIITKSSPCWRVYMLLWMFTAGSPEEVRSSNDHVLKIFEWQTSVVVQVGLIDHLLAHHPHLVFCQLVTSQLVQRLLQVWLADEVIVVEILQKNNKRISTGQIMHQWIIQFKPFCVFVDCELNIF